MKALVLAGGKGTRLRPLTYTMAKQLVPVANRPVVHYVMAHLEEAGIREVGVVVAPETQDQIRASLDPNPWGLDLTYLLQDEPLGLAHTVLLGRDFLQDEPFVMYLGDNLIGRGIGGLIEAFRSSNADAAVLLKQVSDPSGFGVADVGPDGAIRRLVEKPEAPTSDLALVGVYCFSPSIHRAVAGIRPSARGELEITDAIQYLLDEGDSVIGQRLDTWWLDCGKKDDLLDANRIVLDEGVEESVLGDVDEASRIEGRVLVERGATVRDSTVRGPAIVGEGTEVSGSFIGPYSSIGPGCRVLESALEHCVVLAGATIERIQRLEDSVIGESSLVSRSRGDHRAIRLMVGEQTEVLL